MPRNCALLAQGTCRQAQAKGLWRELANGTGTWGNWGGSLGTLGLSGSPGALLAIVLVFAGSWGLLLMEKTSLDFV